MTTLTIKNIPRGLYTRLKESAAQHRRSINSEVIACLERTLASRRVDPEEFLAKVRAARRRISGFFVTEKELREARNEGRL